MPRIGGGSLAKYSALWSRNVIPFDAHLALDNALDRVGGKGIVGSGRLTSREIEKRGSEQVKG